MKKDSGVVDGNCLQIAVEASDRAVLIVDTHGHIQYVNPYFEQMYGIGLAEAVTLTADQAFFSKVEPDVAISDRESLWADRGRSESYCMTEGKNGQRYWTRLVILPTSNTFSGQRVVLATDVTGGRLRRSIQNPVLEALVRDEPVLDAMNLICREIEAMTPGVKLILSQLDETEVLRPLAAPSFTAHRVLSWSAQWGDSETWGCFERIRKGQPVFVTDVLETPFGELLGPAPTRSQANQSELAVAADAVAGMPLACWIVPIRSSDDEVVGVLACVGPWRTGPDAFLVRIVEHCRQLCVLTLERHLARQKLELLSFYDTLTGLPNRRQLQLRADELIAAAACQQGELAVIFMDVDRLTHVNDSLGYLAGDIMLRAVAERLAKFDDRALAGRLSGDEFVLVIQVPAADRVQSIVERLQLALSEPVDIAGMRLGASVSIGVSLYPADGQDIETLLHRADIALHQAKADGAGSSGFFSHDMNQASHGRLVMEAALRNALRTSQLELHYQPQVYMDDGRLYGVEALLRWQHPEWGMIGPDRFIPLAEEQGLMTPLGLWVLAEACRQLHEWRSHGLEVPAISINMSASSLRSYDLPQHIASTLAAHGLQAADLRIEVTESVMLDSDPATMGIVREIENLGVRLSIDDFGTGYSSWGYLKRLPLDEIKLDRSFVQAVAHDDISRILSQAVVSIGDAMKLVVIAEGVETQEDFDLLRRQGFDVVQGYLIARPMSHQAFEVWLAARDDRLASVH